MAAAQVSAVVLHISQGSVNKLHLFTSNATGRHRGLMQKLQADYRALSLQCCSIMLVMSCYNTLLCEYCHITDWQVWYCALSVCYVCTRCLGIICTRRLPLCQILFLSRPEASIAELAHREKSCTQLLTQSINHPAYLMPQKPKLSLQNTAVIMIKISQ